jgi:hypothetical protein
MVSAGFALYSKPKMLYTVPTGMCETVTSNWL